MRISTDSLDACSILHLAGEFGTLDCPLFLDQVRAELEAGRSNVVVNLRLTKYINSTALGAIIKASRLVKEKGGVLAVSRPSSTCRTAIESLGLDQIVPVFDSDELAVQGLTEELPEPDLDNAEPIGKEDSTVLFAPTDQARVVEYVGKTPRKRSWHGVGHVAELDTTQIRFHWDGGNTGLGPDRMAAMLGVGVELRVKFRLPMLQRGYREAVVAVTEANQEADGVRVVATYRQLDGETMEAVRQYTEDMAFLKSELNRSAGE